MKPSDNNYAISDFTHELVADVKAGGYGLRAWKVLLARSWARSIDDIRASPARARSLVQWSAVGAVVGAGILGLTLAMQDSGLAFRAIALWLPWYAGTVLYVLTHLGLAPLVLLPFSSVPTHPSTALVFALTLVLLAMTDALDGWIARKREVETRMGRMLDPLADVAFLAFLAAGLFAAGVLPTSLFVLLMLRYPGALVGVVLLYFFRGPGPLRPTVIGRATSLVTSVILTAFSLARLLQLQWVPARWIDWCVGALYVVISINLAYLVGRAITWRAAEPG